MGQLEERFVAADVFDESVVPQYSVDGNKCNWKGIVIASEELG